MDILWLNQPGPKALAVAHLTVSEQTSVLRIVTSLTTLLTVRQRSRARVALLLRSHSGDGTPIQYEEGQAGI